MRTFRNKLGLAIVLCLIANTAFGAFTYSFVNITGNSATNAAIGEAQLSMTVSDYGSNQALFTFNNTGPEASFIGQIYWENPLGLLDGIAGFIQNTADVNFVESTGNLNLPGGNAIAFIEAYGAEADSPGSNKDGVDEGEELGVIFDLDSLASFADLIVDLDAGLMRVGLHVQGFADGGSESFVNDGRKVPPVIPVPAALPLALFGMLGLRYFRKASKAQ